MDHDIHKLAALLTVVNLTFSGFKLLWRCIRKPVKKVICWIINRIIDLLVWIKHILEKDDGDSNASNNNGVPGGVA